MATNLAPTLQLNFAKTKRLDPRITFSRASSGGYHGADGLYRLSAINEPRFDHDPATGVSKGLLIEEARTNLLTYSEQFDNAAWTKVDTTVSANAIAAPDGTATADKLVENTANAVHVVSGAATSVSGTTYTLTVFAKSDGSNRRLVLFMPDSGYGTATNDIFDLITGTVITQSSGTATISSVGGGWYKCTATRTATLSASAAIQFRISKPDAADVLTYTGDGTSGLYIWGAQLEAGAFPTSYIPTTSAAATRSADVASMTGTNFSSWYRQDEGTFVSRFRSSGTASTTNYAFSAGNGASTELIGFRVAGLNNQEIVIDSATQAEIAVGTHTGALVTLAGCYKLNDFALYAAGVAATPDTSGTIPTPDRLVIGAQDNNANPLNGHISSLAYFNTRVDNTTLKQLSATTSNDVAPSLQLNFAKTKRLDPRVTFSRASTATYYDAAGVLRTCAINEPRFDHDPVSLVSKGLLIEEARTNLLTYSEQFDNAAWFIGGDGSVSANSTASPSGMTTADTYTIGTNSTVPNRLSTTLAASTTYTISIFFHSSSTATFLRIRITTNAGSVSSYVNISTKAFSSIGAGFSGGAVETLPGGWYRASIQYLPATGDEGSRDLSFGGATANGGGVADTGKTLVIWGAQLEAGAFATSYIPTTTAAATRSADVASMTGTNFSSWYNQTEGSFVSRVKQLAASGTRPWLRASNNTADEVIELRGTGTNPEFYIADGAGNNTTLDLGTLSTADITASAAYKVSDLAGSVSGGTTVAGSETIPTPDRLFIGNDGANYLTGTIERLTYFPRRLDNTTLQGLSL